MYTALIATTTGASAALVAFIAGALLSLRIGVSAMRSWDERTGGAEPDDDGWWIDQDDRDAIGRLLAAAAIAYNNPVANHALPPQQRKALSDALTDAEDRFHDFLEGPFLEDVDGESVLDEALR